MRLISYQGPHGPRIAGVRGKLWVDIQMTDPSLPGDMRELLQLGPNGLKAAATAVANGHGFHPFNHKLLAPVPNPEKVICIGLNYADHAAESGQPIPAEPVVFCKFPTAVRAHEDPIELPTLSDKVDYEAELVVIIGKGGRNIPRAQAMEHVAGYTCGHDVSARDWQLQKPGGQWLLGKTFDSFAPFGPELVTSDEIPDAGNLNICLRLNGQVMQSSNTRQLIFPIDQLVSYLSGVCTLTSGDVIFTGTPPGVGGARKPPVYLKAGDVTEVEIERIGVLKNPVVAARR